MIVKSLLVLLACSTCLLVIKKSIAMRVTPNVEEFMIENHRTRTRTRQDYMVRRAFEEDLSSNVDNLATLPEGVDAEMNPAAEISSQILDCANMIRNDIIYSDNSVETTTRKRGNISKKNLLAMPAPPCSCNSEREEIFLGDNFFPIRLESLKCLDTCSGSYHCKAINYWVIVLKKTEHQSRKRLIHPMTYHQLSMEVPHDFRRWEPHRVNVTTSCVCTADENEN